MGLNQVVLAGTVKELPELKETEKGNPYAELVIQIDDEMTDKVGAEQTNEISVLILNDIAQKVVEYAKVGDMVAIKGSIKTILKDQANGKNYYVYSIIASNVFFLGA